MSEAAQHVVAPGLMRRRASSGTVSERLAGFALGVTYPMLPKAVADKTKLMLLDTVGVCVGSSQLDDGRTILRQCASWSGGGDCTLIGSDRRAAPQYAAFGNGALGHGQDYDDTHTESIVHPSCVLVPSVLASAERHDQPGADALATLAAATEAIIRLALPSGGAINRRGFQATSSLGAFGGAMIAARAGEFSLDQAVNAVGIAGSFSSGLMECVPAGAASKQFQPGWGGFCGVMAADLAQAGFTGPRTIFEGPLGYFAAFLHGMPVDPEDVFSGLHDEWELLNVRPKLFPCAHNVHAAIECAAFLRNDAAFELERISSVLCEPPQGAVAMVCEPWAKKIAPETGYNGRFSLAYVVAVMLVHGRAGIDAYTDELVHDPAIRALMARTTYRVNPAVLFKDMPGRVTVTLTDGTKLMHEIPAVRGNAANPIGTDELQTKFETNTACLGRERSARVADMIMGLERLPSLRPMMAELTMQSRDPS